LLQHFLKIFLRHTLKNKFGNTLNLLGLSFAFGLTYVVGFAVNDTVNSDSWLSNSDRAYRVIHAGGDRAWSATPYGPTASLVRDNIEGAEAASRLVNRSITVTHAGHPYNLRAAYADPDFANIFNLPMIEGKLADALINPVGLALSERQAKQIFGQSPAVGKTLTITRSSLKKDYVIEAVFKDLPEASHFNLNIILPLIDADFAATNQTNLLEGYNNTGTVAAYVLLAENVSKSVVVAGFNERMLGLVPQEELGQKINFALEPVVGIQFWSQTPHGHMKNPIDRLALIGTSILTAFVLIAAISNHIGLTIAVTLRRGREVAMRLILGASKRAVIQQLFAETLIVMSIAVIFALDIAAYLEESVGGFFGQSIDTATATGLPGFIPLLGLAFLCSLLTALYPAAWLARMKSRDLLAGADKNVAGSGNRARTILVGIQLALGAALLFATVTVYRHTDYLLTVDKGFNHEGLLHINLPNSGASAARKQTFLHEIAALDGIEKPSQSYTVPFVSNTSRYGFNHPRTQKLVQYEGAQIDPAFFGLYEIKLLAGRFLNEDLASDLAPAADAKTRKQTHFIHNIILSEAAVKAHGFASNDAAIGGLFRITSTRGKDGENIEVRQIIVGVIPELNFKAGKRVQTPTFYEHDTRNFNYLSVRITAANEPAVVEQIREVWTKAFPDQNFNYSFAEDNLKNAYWQENQMLDVFSLAGLVCLVITAAGLSGLARFVALQRRREFAIRRVVGASQRELLRLALLQFGKPVFFGLLAGIPTAYYFLQSWLSQYQVSLEPSFIEGLLFSCLVAIFALAIVLYEVQRGTQFRPADILGHE